MGTNRIWRGLSLAAAGIIAAVALQGCTRPASGDAQTVIGKDQGPQLETRQGNAPRAGASGEFEFVRYSIDVTKDLPRACLTFSSTLNPSTDYRPFLDMGNGPQIALQTEGANLCLGGLTFGTDREITIRSGLPANDGRTLPFEETVGISFGDRPAYVGFKGDGVILPRIDADGLGLETVNVDKVKVTISRITPNGGTALYDAVLEALPLVRRGHHQKKALVIISDGNDTSSLSTLRDVRAAVRDSEDGREGQRAFLEKREPTFSGE